MTYSALAVLISISVSIASATASPAITVQEPIVACRLIRVEVVNPPADAAIVWDFEPDTDLDFADSTGDAKRQFVAPVGRLRIKVLLIAIKDGRPIVTQLRRTIDVADPGPDPGPDPPGPDPVPPGPTPVPPTPPTPPVPPVPPPPPTPEPVLPDGRFGLAKLARQWAIESVPPADWPKGVALSVRAKSLAVEVRDNPMAVITILGRVNAAMNETINGGTWSKWREKLVAKLKELQSAQSLRSKADLADIIEEVGTGLESLK